MKISTLENFQKVKNILKWTKKCPKSKKFFKYKNSKKNYFLRKYIFVM